MSQSPRVPPWRDPVVDRSHPSCARTQYRSYSQRVTLEFQAVPNRPLPPVNLHSCSRRMRHAEFVLTRHGSAKQLILFVRVPMRRSQTRLSLHEFTASCVSIGLVSPTSPHRGISARRPLAEVKAAIPRARFSHGVRLSHPTAISLRHLPFRRWKSSSALHRALVTAELAGHSSHSESQTRSRLFRFPVPRLIAPVGSG